MRLIIDMPMLKVFLSVSSNSFQNDDPCKGKHGDRKKTAAALVLWSEIVAILRTVLFCCSSALLDSVGMDVAILYVKYFECMH